MQPAGISEIDPAIEALLNRHEERLVFLHPVWLRSWLAEFGDRYEPLLIDCLDDELTELYDAPVRTAALRWGL